MARIYIDYAASTPVDPLVLKEMLPYFGKKYGNPGSLHFFGQEAIAAIDRSRETIARAIGADFCEIIFTGSATEANNLALRGITRAFSVQRSAFGQTKKPLNPTPYTLHPQIIVSAVEHESILETARDLEKDGVEVIYVPVDKGGFVDLEKLKSSLNERTVLVSVMYVNNRIGTVQPITEIAKIIKAFRVERSAFSNTKTLYPIPCTPYPLFHTDAAQAFQYLDCDVQKLGVDLMTLSAQKIYGPKGIGALYVRDLRFKNKDLRNESEPFLNPKSYILNPIVTGGGQEFGLHSGTENVPAIVGFGKAIQLVLKSRTKEVKRMGELREYFWRGIKKIFPKAEKNGGEPKVPNILNIYFPGFSGRDLLIKLDVAGIAVSAGAACSVRAAKPCYVLEAIGSSPERISGSLRFSFGKYTTRDEIEKTLKRLKKVLS